MSGIPRALAFLGPQRFEPTLARAVAALGIEGDLATVTAGWQEREREVEELHEHLGGRAVNLELHRRGEAVFAADAEFAGAYRRRQELFRQMQDIYALRLDAAMSPCLALAERPGHERLLEEERAAALEGVRALDEAHAGRMAEVHAEFDARWRPAERDALRHERAEIARLIGDSTALAIAGGHVAVLANRLKLFDLLALTGDRPVLAWSGGAMACAERVVLFHDHPPHGTGHAQLLDAGLGLAGGLVFLPHARRRLDLGDTIKTSLLARRFTALAAVVLEDGASLTWRLGEGWSADAGCLKLGEDGALTPLTVQGVAA
ncbi:MAG: hypothetical protein ABI960_04585 [Candidatus Eisenbacteria bacterium]